MNKFVFYLLTFFVFSPSALVHSQTPNATTFTYEGFKGTIGTFPVQLFVESSNGNLSGSYFYERTGQPIRLEGTLSGKEMKLSANINGKEELFSLSPSGQTLTGTWKQKGSSKSLPVSLKRSQSPRTFSEVNLTDSIQLFAGKENSPTCHVAVNSFWPKGSDATDDFIRNMLVLEFFKDKKFRDASDPIQIAGEFISSYFENYRSEQKDLSEADAQENSFSYSAELSLSVSIQYYAGDLLSVSSGQYEYTGGAHGNTYISYTNLDLRRKKQLKLEEVVTPAGIRKLPSLLESQFRKDNKLSATASLTKAGLFEDKIKKPSKEFYITGKGIGFFYNQYEIAPYASGGIEIFIPFSSLTGLLQPSFLPLLKNQ